MARKGFLALVVCLLAMLPAFGQEYDPSAAAGYNAFADSGPNYSPNPCIWASLEYLVWWYQNAPLAQPIVTTFTVGGNSQGQLGNADTLIEFGNNGLDFSALSGGRATIGLWLESSHTYGVEATPFILEQARVRFAMASDAAGNPPIAIPIINNVGQQISVILADPNSNRAGAVNINAPSRMFGGEADGIINLCDDGLVHLDILLGGRYQQLDEKFTMTTVTVDINNPLNTVTTLDIFGTRNQFYGGQFGAKLSLQPGSWSFDVKGRIAMGVNRQILDINGNTVGTGAFILASGPGGIFTQPSNIGHYTRGVFAVVPEVNFKAAYRPSQSLALWIGYDCMYWSSVARAAGEINPAVNVTVTAPVTLDQFRVLVPPPAPARQFNDFGMWAQGFNLGIEISF